MTHSNSGVSKGNSYAMEPNGPFSNRVRMTFLHGHQGLWKICMAAASKSQSFEVPPPHFSSPNAPDKKCEFGGICQSANGIPGAPSAWCGRLLGSCQERCGARSPPGRGPPPPPPCPGEKSSIASLRKGTGRPMEFGRAPTSFCGFARKPRGKMGEKKLVWAGKNWVPCGNEVGRCWLQAFL